MTGKNLMEFSIENTQPWDGGGKKFGSGRQHKKFSDCIESRAEVINKHLNRAVWSAAIMTLACSVFEAAYPGQEWWICHCSKCFTQCTALSRSLSHCMWLFRYTRFGFSFHHGKRQNPDTDQCAISLKIHTQHKYALRWQMLLAG